MRQLAQADELYQRVADNRCFARPGEDGNTGGVSGELVEQPVAGAAADHMNDLDRPSGQSLQFEEHIPVGQRKAFKDTAGDGGVAVRARLPALLTEGANVSGMIARRQEAVVVGIDKRTQRFGRLCQRDQFRIGVGPPLLFPGGPALLQ